MTILIYIYGPPASGKLTVSKELAKLTTFKVFHNHLTVDLLKEVLEFGTDIFFKLSSEIRLSIIEAAAAQKINGIILTSCYSYPQDNEFIRKLIKRTQKHKAQIYFVYLYCEVEQLKKRVVNNSRKKYGKVKSIKGLEKSLNQWNMFTPIPFVKSLQINNTKKTAKQVANEIITHHNIKKI